MRLPPLQMATGASENVGGEFCVAIRRHRGSSEGRGSSRHCAVSENTVRNSREQSGIAAADGVQRQLLQERRQQLQPTR